MVQPTAGGAGPQRRRDRLLRYHRAGYAGSSRLAEPLTFAHEAEIFRALMRHLGIHRAHVVGHSASGCIALQIALDVSDGVHSLALLEPALMAVPSPPEVPRALELYRAGDTRTAIDTFLRGTCGPHYRDVLEKAIPGALDQALTDADTFFGHELPALRQWSFGPDEARRVKHRSSPFSARRAIRASIKGRTCCSSGCRTLNRSCSPGRGTCSTCRIPAAWRTAWLPFSCVTRSAQLRSEHRHAAADFCGTTI